MKKIHEIDQKIIDFLQKTTPTLGRISIFVIYGWFGFLKIIGMSPASPLIDALLEKTLWFWPAESFILTMGVVEFTIGSLFLFPKLTRLAILILVLHLSTTIMPLFLLPDLTWQNILVPTLEGQYIIKNLVIIAVALLVGSTIECMKPSESKKASKK